MYEITMMEGLGIFIFAFIVAVLLVGGFCLLQRYLTVKGYRDFHSNKTNRGFSVVKTEREGWSDGVNIVVTYSDGTKLLIWDTYKVPEWVLISEKK